MGDDEGKKVITVQVKVPNMSEPISLRVKPDTPFEKIFIAVAKNLAVDKNTLRFLFNGDTVGPNQTPKMLELEEGDQLDCMIQQTGGGAGEDAKVVEIRVVIPGAANLTLKVKDSTKMSKLFAAVANQTGRAEADFRFFFDGSKVKPNQTVKDVGMEDGDQLDAMVEQVGGVGRGDRTA
jgi:small ubiquitin-related modifier